MYALNTNKKGNSHALTLVLEQVSRLELSLSDIEKAVGIFEKVSDILIQLSFPLSDLISGKNVKQNSSEFNLQNLLTRLRIASIDLLSCRRNNLKRKSSSLTPKAKRRKGGDLESSSLVQLRESSCGVGLLEICYVCKVHCTSDIPKHEFYPWMCCKCGYFNFEKRSQSADLNGKVALVTGGRIKIGFEIVLKLLRCGASVVTTTRFPNDARRRYQLQADYSQWASRLHIYGLDLRFLPQVNRFCEYFSTHFPQLDIFIQNAAQTIRRPTVYYKALVDGEREPISIEANSEDTTLNRVEPNDGLSVNSRKETSQLLIHPEDFKYFGNPQLSELHFPTGVTDDDGDQLDLRPQNTWTTALDEVETEEMVEVTLANYMSPFVLLQKLTSRMAKGRNSKSWAFIILVSAMEGKFSECKKTGKHPHTNAAKAALNMLVRTSARYYKKMGILMNAVDTGWVTDEHPVGSKSRLMSGLKAPLDSVDGAARVLDPIFQTVNDASETPVYGKFLKDYRIVGW
ncbi:hypothetical protein Bhyg_06316 [Pseudolycoriella hygida]|uniref:Short-chain dehydrogenase n=1 Tax=Pseudolycoriella hygida TaxID=35572 RepID=A0A9Q0N0E3_9DIPT|nr:hypothetical protein Bhyg_06316 [Pseudolycoriella hygida]